MMRNQRIVIRLYRRGVHRKILWFIGPSGPVDIDVEPGSVIFVCAPEPAIVVRRNRMRVFVDPSLPPGAWGLRP